MAKPWLHLEQSLILHRLFHNDFTVRIGNVHIVFVKHIPQRQQHLATDVVFFKYSFLIDPGFNTEFAPVGKNCNAKKPSMAPATALATYREDM